VGLSLRSASSNDGGRGSGAHYLATGATTDGRFGLYRWEMGPRPGGPAPHIHRAITESFYVLEGLVRIFDGDTAIGRAAAEGCARYVTGDYRFVELPGVTHWIPEQAPRELATAVLDRIATG